MKQKYFLTEWYKRSTKLLWYWHRSTKNPWKSKVTKKSQGKIASNWNSQHKTRSDWAYIGVKSRNWWSLRQELKVKRSKHQIEVKETLRRGGAYLYLNHQPVPPTVALTIQREKKFIKYTDHSLCFSILQK